jgi:glycosyl transferase family 25
MHKSINIAKDGLSTVNLYHHTDTVFESVDTNDEVNVKETWPECLRNILIITIRPDRLARCIERLGSLRTYATIIEGVNGETIDIKQMEESGDLEYLNEWNKLTRGQIGCFLSHRRAWKKIAEGHSEYGFIIEDDCDLRPAKQTLDVIQSGLLEAKDMKWDILYIARNPALCKIRKRLRPHVVQVGKTWGLFAYVVSKKAAKELLNESEKIRGNAVDIFVSCTRKAARLKLAISPIPFLVVDEISDTIGIK